MGILIKKIQKSSRQIVGYSWIIFPEIPTKKFQHSLCILLSWNIATRTVSGFRVKPFGDGEDNIEMNDRFVINGSYWSLLQLSW